MTKAERDQLRNQIRDGHAPLPTAPYARLCEALDYIDTLEAQLAQRAGRIRMLEKATTAIERLFGKGIVEFIEAMHKTFAADAKEGEGK